MSSIFSFIVCTDSKADKEKGEVNRGDKRTSGKMGVDGKMKDEKWQREDGGESYF